jgi:peroxiredoxin
VYTRLEVAEYFMGRFLRQSLKKLKGEIMMFHRSVLCCQFILFGLLLLLFSGCQSDSQDQATEKPSRPMAADFVLSSVNGDSVQLSSLKGKVVVLNFWATWCPPCREEMPSMEKLHQMMKHEDFVLLAVNIEADGRRTVPQFLQKQPVSFAILYDEEGKIHKQYGVFKYPETFIIDRNGRIVEKVVGGLNWAQPRVVEFLRQVMVEGAH